MPVNLVRKITEAQAREILRKAVMKCGHPQSGVIFQNTFMPNDLEEAEAKNAWRFNVSCNKCDASASVSSDSPVCESCSTLKQPALFRLVTTKDDPVSRYGKVFVYTCDKCKTNKEITFKSGYS